MKVVSQTGLTALITKTKAWVQSKFLSKTDTSLVQEISVDTTPTQNSSNLITSGGVYADVSGVNDGTNWTSLTLHGTTKGLAGGGGGEPSAYLKNASISGRTLTLTKKDDSTVTFTESGTEVSGSKSGNNWSSITIGGTQGNIPTYSLPTASSSRLGGVKVGSNLSITSGVLSADVPLNWGSGNAGKFFVVGNDGNMTLTTLATWQGGSY